jgi:hypothetical protein
MSVMSGWYAERAAGRSARAMIAVLVLALLLVAAVPVALLAAVIMMALGHVVGGLAVFGGSVLVAGLAVALAGLNGMRQMRKLLSGSGLRVVPLDTTQYADVTEPAGAEPARLVQLDRSEYTDVNSGQ